MKRPLGFMSEAVFERVVTELAEVNRDNAPGGIVYLHHFGESLLHRRLDSLGRLANRLGLLTSLSVNPIALRGAVVDRLLNAEIGILQFALDGYDSASFAAARGVADAYEMSVDLLRHYLARHRAARAPSRIVVNVIDVPGLDARRLAAEAERWRDEPGVDAVYRKPFVTWNGTSASTNALSGHRTAPLMGVPGPITCREPFESLSIAWDGSVLACCFDYDRFFVLGNVLEESLASLWNGSKMRALRAEFIANRVTNELCRSCNYLRSPISDTSVLQA